MLQQGLAGYAGVRDTFVSSESWDSPPQFEINHGRNPTLTVSRDGRNNVLVRFELGSIPPNAAVSSARLSLYNTTSPPNGIARRIKAFRVLRSWDEGNQVASALDAPGKRGATGENAFAYFPGEGTNVPWSEIGLGVDTDYEAVAMATVEVRGPGWYEWNLSAVVQEWVRHPGTNRGLVLRDDSGFQPLDTDERDFLSSDASDAPLRPRLTLDLDVETPFADAGPDLFNRGWRADAVTLNGSASHDHPGGDDSGLTFEWRVKTAAYGSGLAGTLVSTAEVATFLPDRPGEWEIELTVTNSQGKCARDRVELHLLSLAGHPRIFLTPQRLDALRLRAQPSNPRWTRVVDAAGLTTNMIAQALVFQVTGDTAYADMAIAAALESAPGVADGSIVPGDLALVYDWCHSRLTAAQQATLRAAFNDWAAQHAAADDVPGWGNYWPRFGEEYVLMGLATFGEDASALGWMNEYRYRRFRDYDQPALDRIAAGGGWPEGTVYDSIANLSRIEAAEAWRSATGEDLFESTKWFKDRLGFLLLNNQPGLLADDFGYLYHPYNSTGDAERFRGAMVGYERLMGLLLTQRFSGLPLARQLQAYLAASSSDEDASHFPDREFLFFDPEVDTDPPTRLTHYAAGTGTLFARSGWPRGAVDDDPRATYLTFQCGDHFSYHQHFDQNAFTLFKGGDLVVDSGVYSGDGQSHHDINYYVRTIAHNTLVVYNPDEDFSAARPGASSNDGGQRTYAPASRAPSSVEEWDADSLQHDTCDMLNFEDTTSYTYAHGDATKAYNNPAYNQATDGQLPGNQAKVSRFQREMTYLRPTAEAPQDYVILYDRVGVTQPTFSGANTKLLFHFLQEPAVGGPGIPGPPGEKLYPGAPSAVAESGDGRVFLEFLAPAARNLRKVGGRGQRAFWVFGANYDWHWSPKRTAAASDDELRHRALR